MPRLNDDFRCVLLCSEKIVSNLSKYCPTSWRTGAFGKESDWRSSWPLSQCLVKIIAEFQNILPGREAKTMWITTDNVKDKVFLAF